MIHEQIPYQLHWVTYFCEMWSEEFIYRAFNWSVKILLMNLFIMLSKTNKINNIYFQLLRDRKKNYQLKSIPSLNPKQQTDLVNNFSEQMSSLVILPLLRLKGGILVTVHQKYFYWSILIDNFCLSLKSWK
jgi:hypothetical protein